MYRCEKHGHLTFISRSQQLNEVPACAEKSNSTYLVCRDLPQTYGGGYTHKDTQRHGRGQVAGATSFPAGLSYCFPVVPTRRDIIGPGVATPRAAPEADPQNITERTEGSRKPGGRRQLDRQSQNKFHLWEISRWPRERKRSRDAGRSGPKKKPAKSNMSEL